MGSVWRVQDDGGQEYAMKILRESTQIDDADADESQRQARIRLRREALALQKVHHPGVCNIVDMELDASIAFIVTELIEGNNLREDVAANGAYVSEDLYRLTHKLIQAVKAVHASGIIHRDIKPTNVMIAARGPVLVDFGIAMSEGESHVTRTGLVMGTPGFIAPEIIEGNDSDEITDWWSLAAVLAFAATGKPVFGTKPMMAVLERAASGNAMLFGLPQRTMQAFRSALNPHREERCTPEALEEAIRSDADSPFADSLAKVSRETARDTLENPRNYWQNDYDENTIRRAPIASTVPLAATPLSTTSLSTTALVTTPLASTPLTAETTVLPQEPSKSPVEPMQTAQPAPPISPQPVPEQPIALQSVQQTPDLNHYRHLGALLYVPIMLILASLACVDVVIAFMLLAFFLWITQAFGYNIAARTHRLHANDGIAGHDRLISIVSFPWHCLKSALVGMLHMLIIAIAGIVGAYLYPLLTGTALQTMTFTLDLTAPINTINIVLPTYMPPLFSTTAIGYAIGFNIGWILLFFAGRTRLSYVALGAIFGSSR